VSDAPPSDESDVTDELDEPDEDDGDEPSLLRPRLLARDGPPAPDAREELLETLEAPSEVWRLTALQALLRIEPAASLADRAAPLLAARDPYLQATVRRILARAGRADVRDLALRALGRRGVVDEAPWPVRPRVARRHGLAWPLRRLAALALGDAGTPEARAALREVLAGDPDWAVREAAALGLVAHGAPADAADKAALEAALGDRRASVRRAAAQALSRRPAGQDGPEAWRVPGCEPYFRYLAGHARREYREELTSGTRDGAGRNWAPFGYDADETPAEEAPDDVDPAHPLVEGLGIVSDDAVTRARDLVHHPNVAWPADPLWPTCCGDFAVFHGHGVLDVAPRGDDPDAWFLDALEPDLPYPEEGLDELEAETYAFRCGHCGWWWTSYRE
jgi:HEAT repeat protein